MKVLVLTISDRASKGIYEDLSGPKIEILISEGINNSLVERKIVSDDSEEILRVFEDSLNNDVIITTGGTGIGPRDNTPEITEQFCDKLIPGIAEYLRQESLKETMHAVLSRGLAGIKNSTIIINIPGSVKGAVFCAKILVTIIPHALKMLAGKGH